MAISLASIAASGLPAVGALNQLLTGIQRQEFVVMHFTDRAGLSRSVALQVASGFFGGAVFDVTNLSLLEAMDDVNDLSDAELNKVEFITRLEDHSPSTPDDDSNVKEVAALQFRSSVGSKVRSIAIPSVRDTLVLADSRNDLDLTDNELQAARDEFLSGGSFVIDNMEMSRLISATRKVHRGQQ